MKEAAILVGFPAAGKSTVVEQHIKDGFVKVSRDDLGGSLSTFNDKVKTLILQKTDKLILDNTHTTIESRKELIQTVKKAGYRVVCIHLDTTIEDSMYNAVSRMIKRHGKLFNEQDYKTIKDPNMFPVAALYKARKVFEKPTTSEGFDEIKTIKFKRNPTVYVNKAIILDYDGTLRKTKSGAEFPTDPNDIVALPGRTERLKEYLAKGYILLGVSNQSGVAKGLFTYEEAQKCFEKTNELLGLKIDYRFCSHKVPPITCYCRKPGVGFGVEFIEKYKLNPSECIMVGDLTSDETFAKRCGFKFVHADKFFI